jgi:AcrR family transcriptional regulator
MAVVKSNPDANSTSARAKGPAARAKRPAPRHPRGSVREAFLASALKIILKEGPGALTIRGAAEGAIPPMSSEAPRRHFKSRHDVLTCLAEEGFAELRRRFAVIESAYANPHQRLIELGLAYVEFAAQFPGHFRVMLDLRDRSKGLVAMRRDGMQHLVRCVSALNPGMSPDVQKTITAACWSIVHGLSALHNDRGFVEMGMVPNAFAATRRKMTADVLQAVAVGLLVSSGVGG